jgi:hypothetical protein
MHAALVTAYKDFDMLERLVLRLQSLGMHVFVHVDKRSAGAQEAVARAKSLGAEANSWYSVHWGSRSHLGALLQLMRSALLNHRISYVHTLSGQDYPIKTADSIESICDGRILMDCNPLHALPDQVRDRFEHYHIRDLADPFFRLPYRADEIGVSLQKLLRIRRERTRSSSFIWKGLVWLSMPAEIARYCCESAAATSLWSELRYTALPEEFYFQTLIAGSPYRNQIDLDNRRFMDWIPRQGSRRPVVLDLADWETIRHTNALFARKFDSMASAHLLTAIDRHLEASTLKATSILNESAGPNSITNQRVSL